MEAIINDLRKRKKIVRRRDDGKSRETFQAGILDQDAVINAARARNRAIALSQAEKLKALFDQWDKEDATTDPEELKRRDAEMLELQHALNANRKATGERLPFPELEVRTSAELEESAAAKDRSFE